MAIRRIQRPKAQPHKSRPAPAPTAAIGRAPGGPRDSAAAADEPVPSYPSAAVRALVDKLGAAIGDLEGDTRGPACDIFEELTDAIWKAPAGGPSAPAVMQGAQVQRSKLINALGAVHCLKEALRSDRPPPDLDGAVELLEEELQRIINGLDFRVLGQLAEPQGGTAVCLATFPPERKGPVLEAICGATGMKPAQAKRKIGRLPATFLALLSNSALAEELVALGATATVEQRS